ncbi:unnamed protein product [Clonostachys solani]|uniref:Protein kinase domain-containing protein n=1 Tax=Clonostachys solani TaxID=160281 RepID=A0A9P0EQ11_9HYPO|nr:unnamed protein product [Clonostachys solani]
MEASQNISVLREFYSIDRGYLMQNLDFKRDFQNHVRLFSMLFNIAKHLDVESLAKYGFGDSSLLWAEIQSGFEDPAEGEGAWSKSPDQQWKICFSLLGLVKNSSNLEFHGLSAVPFSKTISIQYIGKDMLSDMHITNSPEDSHNYTTRRIEINKSAGIEKSRTNERDFYILETDNCPPRSSRVAAKKCANIASNELEHSRETLADIFAENKPPCEYQGIKYMWERVLGMISSVVAVHGRVKNLRIDYDITPTTILVSPDRGSRKAFFFDFNTTDYGTGYEADKAQTSAAFNNRTYGKAFPRIHSHRSDPSYLGAPECMFDTMSNIEKCSSMDMWSLGCVLLEISTFITYGNSGLHEFQKQRRMEITSLHGNLGSLDDECFHDSHGRLESVQKFGQGIHRNGRRCDDITPRIVDLVLNRLLVPQRSRCTAFELFNKVNEVIESSKDVCISM